MKDRNSATPELRSRFRLFALHERILAQNPDGKLIDIGAITKEAEGHVARLDVGEISTAPQHSPRDALASLSALLSFDYLDGLFTSIAPTEPHALLDECPSVQFMLDEPLPLDDPRRDAAR